MGHPLSSPALHGAGWFSSLPVPLRGLNEHTHTPPQGHCSGPGAPLRGGERTPPPGPLLRAAGTLERCTAPRRPWSPAWS